jgi:hypothetical protein
MAYVTHSARQRAPVPFNRGPRRLDSAYSCPDLLPRTVRAPGIEDQHARYPGDEFDTAIRRDRIPWIPRPSYIFPADGWVNWTACGPIRPTLHMRCATIREMQGNSNTRQDQDPTNLQRGLHTNPPDAVARTMPRYVSGNPQMQPGRQDRLSPAQYNGQSFSQTTVNQGA